MPSVKGGEVQGQNAECRRSICYKRGEYMKTFEHNVIHVHLCECVCTVCVCVSYLVYKLLHPLHGMVSLQQRSHSHETFIAVPVILFLFLFLLLLPFPSSVILFVYSSVLIALRDALTRENRDIVRSEGL